MITENTVFILGAGASAPYGFPTGEKLRADIITSHSTKFNTYFSNMSRSNEIENFSQEIEKHNFFIQTFDRSGITIDEFITINKEEEDLGKKIIAFQILSSELSSQFNEKTVEKESDWYKYLWKELRVGVIPLGKIEDFLRNKVSFITFNYDRSLEYYLYKSLFNAYGSKKDVAIILNQIPIIHINGKLNNLYWENQELFKEYKQDFSYNELITCSKNLNVLYDRRENGNKKAIELINNANQVFILGFGFADENLKSIGLPESFNNHQKIYCTAYKLTQNEINKNKKKLIDIKKDSGKVYENLVQHLKFEDMNCLELLKNYL